MAACPDVSPLPHLRRRPLTLTQRRLEANRRNAARSTGPRTARGKARVARNAIKHGFFVGQERWTPAQHRDFEALLDGLRDDVRPEGIIEESCVRTIAESYVRMAAVLRYENIAALRHHQERDRELDWRIAAADATDAARLGARRDGSAGPDCGSQPSRASAKRRRSCDTWAASSGPSRPPHHISSRKNKPTIRQRRIVALRLCEGPTRSDSTIRQRRIVALRLCEGPARSDSTTRQRREVALKWQYLRRHNTIKQTH